MSCVMRYVYGKYRLVPPTLVYVIAAYVCSSCAFNFHCLYCFLILCLQYLKKCIVIIVQSHTSQELANIIPFVTLIKSHYCNDTALIMFTYSYSMIVIHITSIYKGNCKICYLHRIQAIWIHLIIK